MHEQPSQGVVHEHTYEGLAPAALLHRRRLRRIVELMQGLEIPLAGKLADFGCSNGFILSVLQAEVFQGKQWSFYGFDRSEALLSLARAKELPSTYFQPFDLNVVSTAWCEHFDIVTCFETLEHTGSYRNAVLNLYTACRRGGVIVISVPNESGVPGLLKYAGRKVMRKSAYGDFFDGKSELRYLWHLVSNQSLEVFRAVDAPGWGPHLGFDARVFERFLRASFLESGKCRLLLAHCSPASFGHVYLLERIGQ